MVYKLQLHMLELFFLSLFIFVSTIATCGADRLRYLAFVTFNTNGENYDGHGQQLHWLALRLLKLQWPLFLYRIIYKFSLPFKINYTHLPCYLIPLNLPIEILKIIFKNLIFLVFTPSFQMKFYFYFTDFPNKILIIEDEDLLIISNTNLTK